jgi:hypothetical protein
MLYAAPYSFLAGQDEDERRAIGSLLHEALALCKKLIDNLHQPA